MAKQTGCTTVFEKHPHYKNVLEVHSKLQGRGFKALLAGGCVRDALLVTAPKDFDIATDAHPEDVEKLFPKAVMVGKAFGVCMIPFNGFQVEVTTFRADENYEDGRRPTKVKFTTPEEDAKRRDFTINAMFYDIATGEVMDYVGGQEDLKKQIIKTVGDAKERFLEDHLRILRALRFSSQLGFKIEANTLKAIQELAPKVALVAKERGREEFMKLLAGEGRVKALEMLCEYKIDIIADLEKTKNKWQKRLKALDKNAEALLVLTHLLLPLAEQDASFAPNFKSKNLKNIKQTLMSLKFSNEEANKVEKALWGYIFLAKTFDQATDFIAKARRILAEDYGLFVLQLFEMSAELGENKNLAEKLLSYGPAPLPKMFLSSLDLQKAGVSEGPKMGELLELSLDMQLESKINSRQAALEWLKSQIS